jgi:hypothetical protein
VSKLFRRDVVLVVAVDSGNRAAIKCNGAGIGGRTAEYATAQEAYSMQPDLVAILGGTPFTSDSTEGVAADAWWRLLDQRRAMLILNGHDRVYSRFARWIRLTATTGITSRCC